MALKTSSCLFVAKDLLKIIKISTNYKGEN
jgi:hypothetical protein